MYILYTKNKKLKHLKKNIMMMFFFNKLTFCFIKGSPAAFGAAEFFEVKANNIKVAT